jgi:hypothetical protein
MLGEYAMGLLVLDFLAAGLETNELTKGLVAKVFFYLRVANQPGSRHGHPGVLPEVEISPKNKGVLVQSEI